MTEKKEKRQYQDDTLNAVLKFLVEWKNQDKNPCVVMPTGSGKSWLIAALVKKMREDDRFKNIEGEFPKVIVLSHQKELILQDVAKLINIAPEMEKHIDVYSAGLGRKEIGDWVTFSTIASAYRMKERIEWALAIVDEAHLINNARERGMYRKFLATVPKVVGFTATPYRTTQGLVTDGDDALFHEIIEVESASVANLTKEGFLAKPERLDASRFSGIEDIEVVRGEFDEQSADLVINTSDNNKTAASLIANALKTGQASKALIFCITIGHAQSVTALLREHGINALEVDGTMPASDCKERRRDKDGKPVTVVTKMGRDSTLKSFVEGDTQALCNVGVLTTGFDAPETDLIVFMRPTKSRGLYVQMCGRGQRRKKDGRGFAILDFVGNIDSFGMPDNLEPYERKDGMPFDGRGKKKEIDYHYCRRSDRKWHSPKEFAALMDAGQVSTEDFFLVKECPRCGAVYLVAEEGLTGDIEIDAKELDCVDRCTHRDANGAKCEFIFFIYKDCPVCGKRHKGRPHSCSCGYDFIGLRVPNAPSAVPMDCRPVTQWNANIYLSPRGRTAIRLYVSSTDCIYLTYNGQTLFPSPIRAIRSIVHGSGKSESDILNAIGQDWRNVAYRTAMAYFLESLPHPSEYWIEKKTPEKGKKAFVSGLRWGDKNQEITWLS